VKAFLQSLAPRLRQSVAQWRVAAAPWLRWPDAQEDGRRVAVSLGVVAAVNLLVFLFLTQPLYRLSRVNLAEWEDMDLTMEQRRRSVGRLQERTEQLEQQRLNLIQFYDSILSEKTSRMTAIQREIRNLAGQFQVDPENISYSPTYEEKADLVRFDVSFPLRGSYENLRQFVHRVEISDHFLILDDITLTDAREGGVVLSLNVRMHTFFKDRDFKSEKGKRS
jgi:Tfp pilus assembly protein PilO